MSMGTVSVCVHSVLYCRSGNFIVSASHENIVVNTNVYGKGHQPQKLNTAKFSEMKYFEHEIFAIYGMCE